MSQLLISVIHRHFDTTDSTNTQLIHAIASDTHDHTTHHLYTASHQTAGRGQHGRTWVSGVDNVLLSLYVPMGTDNFKLHTLSGLLSLVVGYKLANLPPIQTINNHRQKERLPVIGVKWANDVGFYDKNMGVFNKLAGILIEPVFKKIHDKNTLLGVVVGVGLNVNHAPIIKDGLYQATCLRQFNIHLTAQDLYTPITNAILQAVQICNDCKEMVYLQSFVDKFNQSHLLTNKCVQIFVQNNMTDSYAQGNCIGIGQQGELLLQHHDSITPIFAGMAQICKDNP